MFRFGSEVGQLGDRGLHPKGHLILADPRLNLGVEALLCQESIQTVDLFNDLPLRTLTDAFGAADVMDRVAARLKLNSLKSAGEEAARPLPGRDRLLAAGARGGEDDETRQVVRLGAKSVEEPRSHAGPALD
jgi:hypothetical protein